MNNFFKPAPDLVDEKVNLSHSKKCFYPAGDLDIKSDNKIVEYFSDEITVDDINKYLKNIISGRKYDAECELGTLCGEGSCIVSFEDLRKMIDEGEYNIIFAECFNKDMISITYQHYNKEYSRKNLK